MKDYLDNYNKYCTVNGKSIVLLNAIIYNNQQVVNDIVVNSSPIELDNIIDSFYIQNKGEFLAGPIDLWYIGAMEGIEAEINSMILLAKNTRYLSNKDDTIKYSTDDPLEPELDTKVIGAISFEENISELELFVSQDGQIT